MDRPAIYAGTRNTMQRIAPMERGQPPLYPGAHRVTKASIAHNCADGPTAGLGRPPNQRRYPGVHWATKALAIPLGNMQMDHFPNKQLLFPRVDWVIKAMELTMAHGNQLTEPQGTTYPRHLRVIGQIHGPLYRLYPRAYWVIKATLWNKPGKQTLVHGIPLLALWQKPLWKRPGQHKMVLKNQTLKN